MAPIQLQVSLNIQVDSMYKNYNCNKMEIDIDNINWQIFENVIL